MSKRAVSSRTGIGGICWCYCGVECGRALGGVRRLADYAVELTVEFDGGTGITRNASREAFRFRTDVPLVPGQRLNGTLSEAGEGDSPTTTPSYSAVVTV